jgi:integrase/recombinase XerD
MAKQAKVLDLARVKQALVSLKSDHERVMFLLSVRAGLRAKEIAGLKWDHVDAKDGTLELHDTKGGEPRRIPIAKDLAAALEVHRVKQEGREFVLTNQHNRPGQPLSANSVQKWFGDLYKRKLGWTAYSSHSGRRTAITKWAKGISQVGGSLKDVQALAGHKDLQTTSRYIETDPNAQKKLVDL